MGTIKLKKMSEAQAEEPNAEIFFGQDETKRQVGEEADFEAAEETEMEHKNTEMIRCFKRNNRMVAKLSAEAQNYFDETDERFKPIDLSWRKENGRLIARCGQRSYSFSENTLEDLVEIGNGPEKLGWTFFSPNSADLSVEYGLEENKKNRAHVVYRNADSGVDLEYFVTGGRVKENIVVKQRREGMYEFSFEIKKRGLTVDVSEKEGRQYLVFKRGENVYFTLPAPYMTDANEQRSEDVYFEVDDIRDESVRFKICADESWINASERAFPVKIDPEVIIGELGHSAAQFYWSYKGASSYTYDDVSVGFEVSSSSSGGSAKTRMGFIQIKLNGIPSGSIVAKAVLKMKVRFKYGWTGTDLNLHKVYKFMGGTSMLGGIEKSFSLTPTDGWLAIDLTSLVKDEMGGSMMLALEPVSGSGYITFDISTLDVQIEYFQPEDNEKTLKTYSIGGGALSVNLFNGEIGYSYASLTAAGKIPVSVYPEFKQKLFTGKGYYFFDGKQASPNFGLGKGWKLNLHEFLVNGARNKTFNGALGSDTVLRMANNNFEQYDAKAFYWKNGIKQFIKMDACKKSGDEYVKDLDGNYLYDDGGVERKAYKVYVNKNKDMLYVNEEIKEICNKILEGYTEEWYELIGQTEKKLDFSNGWNYSLEVGGKTIYVNRRFLKKEEEPGWNYWVYEYYSLEDKKIKKIGPNDMRFISENIEEIKSKGKYIIYKGYFTHSLSESGEGKLEISNLVSAHNESFYKYVYTKKIYKPCYQDTKLQKYIPEELVKAEQLYTQYLENLNSLKMSKCYYQNAKESFYSDSKEQYDKVRDLESSGSGKTFYFNRIYETESQKLNNENVWSYDVQLEKLEKEISEVEEKLIESENTLKNLAEELKKSAVDYLVVGETTMYGYDYYGLLKQITDGTNEVNIQYLQEGIAQKQDGSFAYAEALVDGLYDKDGNALLSFEYEGNRLTKITDGEGKSIYFRYTADQLSAIADNFLYAQELPVYNENGVRINLLEAEPKTIQAGERNCIQFTYNSYHIQSVYDFLHNHLNVGYSEGKIIIKSSNYIAGVSHDCITLSSNIQNSEEETITYSYGVSASVADMHGNKSYYRFNLEGDAYLEYTTRGETNGQLKPVSAVCKTYSYDFNKIKKNTRVSVDVDAVNYIPNGNFSNGFSGWQSTTTLYTTTTESVEGTGVYMGAGKIYQEITVTEALRKRGVLAVSAWAKASCSKHVCGTDSLSCVEGKHTAGTAKFELFATLTMKDATTKTYTAIYDCRNPDWQLVSLPIVDDLKDVEKIQVGIDYTDNNDKIYIDNISLSSAEGSYKVLTVDGLVMEQSDFEEVYTVLSYQDNQPSSVKLRKANGKEVYAWYRYNSKKQILKTEDSEGNITEYTYDENGNQTQKVSYNLADPTSKLYEESRYDEKGRVIAEKDPRGGEYPETTYDYAAGSDNARRIGDTCYEYDISGNIIGKTCTGNEEDNTVNYGYTAGVLTRLENADGTTVDYTYDKKGELSSLKINGEEYAVFSIEETKDSQNVVTQTTKKVTYRGGTSDKATDITFVSFSDKDGNVTQNKVNDTIYNYTYEKNLLQSVKSASGEVLRAYEYDAERRITKEILTAGDTGVWVNYTYDDEGRILQKTFADLGPRDTTTYTYEDDKIISLNISGLLTKSNEYDILDRKRKEEVSFGGKKYQTKYEYLKSGDHATNLIKRIRYGGGTFTGYDGNIEYSYDNNGNISEVVEDGKLVACYEYDKLNRLIRENSKHFDKTVVYRYDRNGNILHKDIYPYTLEKDIRGLAPTESMPYVYSSVWFDQLTEYGAREPRGELFTYDKLGNPIVYRGHTLSWANGRQLTKFGEVKYEYGADGQRTSREVEGVKHEYTYLEGKLFSERWSGNELRYYYDESGVCGIHYNGTKYYFRKNVQGDVTAIYKADGSRVAAYEYDAWGNCKVYDGSGAEKGEADFIGNINPIRYRGYYYDNETKLYYLKTRYYDPEIGRFMNADDVQLLPTLAEEVNGINLYAYCGNNPVMAVDPNGTWSWKAFWKVIAVVGVAVLAVGAIAAITFVTGGAGVPVLIGAGIGAVTSGGLSIFTQWVTTGSIDWLQVGVDFAFGAITGAFGGSTLGILGMTIAGGVTGFASSIISDVMAGRDIQWGLAIASGVIGAVFGALSGGGAQHGKNATLKSKMNLMKQKKAQGKPIKALALEIKNERKLLSQFGRNALKPDEFLLYDFILEYVAYTLLPVIYNRGKM